MGAQTVVPRRLHDEIGKFREWEFCPNINHNLPRHHHHLEDGTIARHRERWPPPPTTTIHGPQRPQHAPKRQERRMSAMSAGKRTRKPFCVGDGEVATNGERRHQSPFVIRRLHVC
ncbi:hypothetical protein K443DRAFT_14394 [Laccaria amethystina LaAM-08-1]|uniref:Uncharacterized protein n=1 Tax=Laccaria amethystina LaAM-08-1 TaxID=1095629 RepID=A0A0C9X1H4_9AGAR|nr:hypothetical protein K443DRAFT_14394 [Laccaria amethystina LaAM-08-1]